MITEGYYTALPQQQCTPRGWHGLCAGIGFVIMVLGIIALSVFAPGVDKDSDEYWFVIAGWVALSVGFICCWGNCCISCNVH